MGNSIVAILRSNAPSSLSNSGLRLRGAAGLCLRRLAVALLAAALGGCATQRAPSPRDPIEPVNRQIFEVNDALDRGVFKPVAEAYRAALPDPVQTGIRNFFSNLWEPWIAINQALQGKFVMAGSDALRFLTNSTIGVVGIFDVASDFELPKHSEDFGQTLAVWGVGFGPYIVLPILGPSSVRDGLGWVADTFAYLPWQVPSWAEFNHVDGWRWSLTAFDFINVRASLLDTTTLLEEAALDRYAFAREAYFQRRRNQIYDGSPPPEPQEASEEEPIELSMPTDAAPGEVDSDASVGVVEPKVPVNYEGVLAADSDHHPASLR
jgi:phospholipid-binding lipoprotein MlaA